MAWYNRRQPCCRPQPEPCARTVACYMLPSGENILVEIIRQIASAEPLVYRLGTSIRINPVDPRRFNYECFTGDTPTPPAPALPEGAQFQVIGYDENDVPVAVNFGLNEWLHGDVLSLLPPGTTVVPSVLKTSEGSISNGMYTLSSAPTSGSIPQFTTDASGVYVRATSWAGNAVWLIPERILLAAQKQRPVTVDMMRGVLSIADNSSVQANTTTVEDEFETYAVTVDLRETEHTTVPARPVAGVPVTLRSRSTVSEIIASETVVTDSAGRAVFEARGPAFHEAYVFGLRVTEIAWVGLAI